MRFSMLLAVVAGWLCSPTAIARGEDWPTYLHDNARLGATGERLVLPLELAWEYTSPAPPEMAWEGPRAEPIEGKLMRHRVAFDNVLPVAVVGDRVYFGSSVDHKLYCVDAATGKPCWQFRTDGPIRLAPTVWQGRVLFGSDDGQVYCLRADDGSLVWSHRVGPRDERLLARGRMISRWPVRTGVLVERGVAYFAGGVIPHETVYLCAVDAASGDLLWKNDRISQEDAGRNPLSPQGYLLGGDDLLVVPSGRSLPAAFDPHTGDELYQRTHSWRTTAGGVVGGSKALLADGQIYSAGPHHFLALDQHSGGVGFAFIAGRQLAISDNLAFVADGQRVAALDRLRHAKATVERQQLNLKQYELQRKRAEMDPREFREQDAELTGKMAALSAVGTLWESPSTCQSALIAAGNLVVAGGENRVSVFDASSGKPLWEKEVRGEAGGLAAAGGRLYVSTTEGKIYCFAGREAAPLKAAQYPQALDQSPYAPDELTAVYAAAAEQILEATNRQRGFCLVVGSERGRLAFELAKRSKLRIYGIETDAQKAAESRELLDRAGLHGTRITIVQGDPAKTPFSNYFANLVVSDTLLLTGRLPGESIELARWVKPCGGQVCLAVPPGAPARRAGLAAERLGELLAEINLNMRGEIQQQGSVALLTRGKLPGAGQWSHQYGDVANTMTSQDFLVKGGLGVLWYGDPGPSKMINRHEAAAAPLSTNGRMFVQGTDSIMAYDAYNGLFLWEYKNPGAIRTGVFNNEEAGNLAASDDALFVAVDDTCTELDAETGEVRRVHRIPASEDGIPRVWGYVAQQDGLLFGTSTVRTELAAAMRRRGHTVEHATDALFAIDLESGERKWLYRGKNILHVTIAIGDSHLFFIDSSISSQQRDELLRQDKSELKKLGAEEARKKEEELKKLDVRLAVALDAGTGKQLWSQAVDVTDCSRVGIGGGQLTLMYHDGHVLICGANANGHYWRQFLTGQFSERRLVVLDAATGQKRWSKDANYRHRPIIVGREIYAEPWAFDLHTGEQKMRENPLTGEETPWQFSRPGHHCGPLTATPNMLFFRSGFTGYYDLYSDSGASHFAGHRLGCWVNAIPGNGLLMIPEASAGCVCQFSIAATIVMEPRADRDSWRIYSATGAQTPVKHMALNLGAPGDRRDSFGTLWLSVPRPNTVGRLEYTFDIQPKFISGGRFFSFNADSLKLEDVATPWLLTSGALGLQSCSLPLRGKNDKSANYSVKLRFVEPQPIEPGQRVFDIKMQGINVAEGVDVAKEAGGSQRELVRSFSGVGVSENLVIEFVARSQLLPVLATIEVEEEE